LLLGVLLLLLMLLLLLQLLLLRWRRRQWLQLRSMCRVCAWDAGLQRGQGVAERSGCSAQSHVSAGERETSHVKATYGGSGPAVAVFGRSIGARGQQILCGCYMSLAHVM
jgi:hypothetical protein